MKVFHIICRRDKEKSNQSNPRGITSVEGEANQYVSCCWYFNLEEMKALIGGMIFFHDTKSEKSYLGGVVLDVCLIELDSPDIGRYYTPVEELAGKKSPRVLFKFEGTEDGKGATWRGFDHARAYYGGIVNIDEID